MELPTGAAIPLTFSKKMNAFATALVIFSAIILVGNSSAKEVDEVPPVKFQGDFTVTKVTWQDRHEFAGEGREDEKIAEGRVENIYFRRHESGALQQFELEGDTEEVKWSRGITVLEIDKNTLKYRFWSDHQAMYRQIELGDEGTMVLSLFWPKGVEIRYLKKKENKAQMATPRKPSD